MATGPLENPEFFTHLTSLLEKTQATGHGSVFLSQKQHAYNPHIDTKRDQNDHPIPILIRVTDGKSQSKDRSRNNDKVKFSTLVQPRDLEAFYTRYVEVCKTGMASLKKRDRSKRKKVKKTKKKDEVVAKS